MEASDWLANHDWREGGRTERRPAGSGVRSEFDAEVVHLYEDCAGKLLRYARSMVPDSQTASDAVQETFLRYLLVRRSGKQIENEHQKAWLFRVLQNLVRDWRRQAGVREEAGIADAVRTRDQQLDPEQEYWEWQLLDRFESLLAPRELACLRLRMAGLRHKEMAEVMGIGLGTVGSMMSRIARKCRPVLLTRDREGRAK